MKASMKIFSVVNDHCDQNLSVYLIKKLHDNFLTQELRNHIFFFSGDDPTPYWAVAMEPLPRSDWASSSAAQQYLKHMSVTYTGWWFGTCFHILGMLIPADNYFSDGVKPPISINL